MAENVGPTNASAESYPQQLLFAGDNVGLVDTEDNCYFDDYSAAFSSENPPKMLCFGDIQRSVLCSDDIKKPAQIACTDSPKANRKRNGCADEPAGAGAPARALANSKRPRSNGSNNTGHGRVKKEKLGERITALQQLVSPYGKTDTASVLHEAMGYIKFLQEQVHVLCSPYLQIGDDKDGEERKDLRGRGLCLVPVEFTSLVANNNGADFWSPAMGRNISRN